MQIVIRIYQIVIILMLIYRALTNKRYRQQHPNQFTVAPWVFYASGIMSLGFSLGLYAMLPTIDEVFLTACLTCTILMYVQMIWKIEYNEDELLFRNSFGIVRKYPIQGLSFIDGDRICKLVYKEKKVAEWDILVVDIMAEIRMARFITQQNEKMKKTETKKKKKKR